MKIIFLIQLKLYIRRAVSRGCSSDFQGNQ
jgi:hypothetical protein